MFSIGPAGVFSFWVFGRSFGNTLMKFKSEVGLCEAAEVTVMEGGSCSEFVDFPCKFMQEQEQRL
jgi:hypothetical protein